MSTEYSLIEHPSAWRADEFASREDITADLTVDQVTALRRATDAVRDMDVNRIGRQDFDLGELATQVADWRSEVLHGRGIVILRGFPVFDHSTEDLERMFFGLGTYFGHAVSQSQLGDRIGHVVDVSKEHPGERGYRSRRELSLHTDSDDIVMMLCLRQAKSGGVNRFTSAVAVYNYLCANKPELLPPLFNGFRYHWRGEEPAGEPPITEYRVPVFSIRDDVLSCVYLRDFIHMAAKDLGTPLSALESQALDRFQALAHDPAFCLDVHLEPGEAFLINNYTVMHSRTEFEDHDDAALRRHLLRLWLKAPNGRPLVGNVRRYYGADGIEFREDGTTVYERGESDAAS